MKLKGLKNYIGHRVKYLLNIDVSNRGKSDYRYGFVSEVSKRTNEICIDGAFYYYKSIYEIEIIHGKE